MKEKKNKRAFEEISFCIVKLKKFTFVEREEIPGNKEVLYKLISVEVCTLFS